MLTPKKSIFSLFVVNSPFTKYGQRVYVKHNAYTTTDDLYKKEKTGKNMSIKLKTRFIFRLLLLGFDISLSIMGIN